MCMKCETALNDLNTTVERRAEIIDKSAAALMTLLSSFPMLQNTADLREGLRTVLRYSEERATLPDKGKGQTQEQRVEHLSAIARKVAEEYIPTGGTTAAGTVQEDFPETKSAQTALLVPPEMETAHQAVASTFGLAAEMYQPAQET